MKNIIDEKKFIETYEPDYYEKNIVSSIRNRTPEKIEAEIEKKLINGMFDRFVFAWKAGTLDYESGEPREKDGNYLTGYGTTIDKDQLDSYIKKLRDKNTKIKPDNIDNLQCAYEMLLEDAPKNFGAVYIINVMYFISKGRTPIYDRFAHKAVKALFADVAPDNVYVGAAPDKKSSRKVMLMYNEYIWLLKTVFGKSKIDRSLDRALWVYGHRSVKYEV